MTLRVWVDYGDQLTSGSKVEGYVTHTLTDFVEGGVAEKDDDIETYDSDGNTCPGKIVFVERDHILYILLTGPIKSGVGADYNGV